MSFWDLGVDEWQPVEDGVLEGVLAGVVCETSQHGNIRHRGPTACSPGVLSGSEAGRVVLAKASVLGFACGHVLQLLQLLP